MSRDEVPAVLLGPSSFGETDAAPRDVIAAAGFRLIENPVKRRLTKDEVRALLTPDVVGLIAGLEPLDRDVLAGSKLRALSRVGSGMSNVDAAAAEQLGIAVRSTPDGPTQAVAELTLASMLALVRGVPAMNTAMHDGAWPKTIGGQLSGKTVAVVGYGRIGRRVASLVRAFGASVIAVDPSLSGTEADGVPVRPLDEALAAADIVTLHVAGENEIIGERELALMPRGSWICNAARGGVVGEAALQRALDSGQLAGAWLDCFVNEPYDGPLRAYPQVLLTPHVGSYTRECRLKMEMDAATNLLEALGAR
jgi:D-3-phosphoglycerate dehydrogenase / 2-oxoglutarate reductase